MSFSPVWGRQCLAQCLAQCLPHRSSLVPWLEKRLANLTGSLKLNTGFHILCFCPRASGHSRLHVKNNLPCFLLVEKASSFDGLFRRERIIQTHSVMSNMDA